MLIKNISARPHWIGDVCIAPGADATVPDMWRGALNKDELIEVVEMVAPVVEDSQDDAPADAPKRRGRPPKVQA